VLINNWLGAGAPYLLKNKKKIIREGEEACLCKYLLLLERGRFLALVYFATMLHVSHYTRATRLSFISHFENSQHAIGVVPVNASSRYSIIRSENILKYMWWR
jgi:hypothetical protein